MHDRKHGVWTRVRNNVRNRMVSGVLLLVPFGVTLLVMRWLFRWLAGFLQPTVMRLASALPAGHFLRSTPTAYLEVGVAALSVVILLGLLYLMGVIGHFVVGRKVIGLGEMIVLRIPLVRTIYTATKQVMEAVSLPDRAAFKSVVLIQFPHPGMRAVGFLTGYLQDSEGRKYCKVFLPTTPNPTTGFFEVVPAEDVTITDMPIEEAFKMVISGGIISPGLISVGYFPASSPGPVRFANAPSASAAGPATPPQPGPAP